MNILKKEIDFAGKKLSLETGEFALQADLSVTAKYGDTVILATLVEGDVNPDMDYFPLSLSYEEKLYASGTIKSSRFMKRDGKPTDRATVTRRLIDHAIRPLFPKDYQNEVQIIITVLSLESDADPEFLSMIAAAAVLHASNVPWNGPMVSTRVGYDSSDYTLNPSVIDAHNGQMDMMISFVGDDMKFLAIEAEMDNLSNEKVLGGIEFGRNNLSEMLGLMNDFANLVNPDAIKSQYESQKADPQLKETIKKEFGKQIEEMYAQKTTKEQRSNTREQILSQMYEQFEGEYKKSAMDKALAVLEKDIIRNITVSTEKRVDGRGFTDIRDISCKVGVLPRTHGTGLFNRGETQALTVATLGNPTSELLIQDMYGERSKKYLHYYNFPPYSTGEIKPMRGPGGREIGHGMLAEKALVPVLPNQEQFPYMILLMSEILGSNGSSSMAATCGSTLALMDAGVPITDMVAGISVGLMIDKTNDKHILLTDIQGLEDFAGYMDFKIAGTKTGITAIQLDMKVVGIPMELLPKIFEQSYEARLKILETMKSVIDTPRESLSKYAPKVVTIKVEPDQVGMIIGSGGKNIKDIQERTKTEIGIEEDGTIFISSEDSTGADEAAEIITNMTKQIQVGEIYDGVIEEVVDFGAFVEILPGRTGLLHVSEVSHDYIADVHTVLSAGDKVRVKVLAVEPNGKMSLSKKALEENPNGNTYENRGEKQRFDKNNNRNSHRSAKRGKKRY